jgi:uncharacterized protein (UPF0335 family)
MSKKDLSKTIPIKSISSLEDEILDLRIKYREMKSEYNATLSINVDLRDCIKKYEEDLKATFDEAKKYKELLGGAQEMDSRKMEAVKRDQTTILQIQEQASAEVNKLKLLLNKANKDLNNTKQMFTHLVEKSNKDVVALGELSLSNQVLTTENASLKDELALLKEVYKRTCDEEVLKDEDLKTSKAVSAAKIDSLTNDLSKVQASLNQREKDIEMLEASLREFELKRKDSDNPVPSLKLRIKELEAASKDTISGAKFAAVTDSLLKSMSRIELLEAKIKKLKKEMKRMKAAADFVKKEKKEDPEDSVDSGSKPKASIKTYEPATKTKEVKGDLTVYERMLLGRDARDFISKVETLNAVLEEVSQVKQEAKDVVEEAKELFEMNTFKSETYHTIKPRKIVTDMFQSEVLPILHSVKLRDDDQAQSFKKLKEDIYLAHLRITELSKQKQKGEKHSAKEIVSDLAEERQIEHNAKMFRTYVEDPRKIMELTLGGRMGGTSERFVTKFNFLPNELINGFVFRSTYGDLVVSDHFNPSKRLKYSELMTEGEVEIQNLYNTMGNRGRIL